MLPVPTPVILPTGNHLQFCYFSSYLLFISKLYTYTDISWLIIFRHYLLTSHHDNEDFSSFTHMSTAFLPKSPTWLYHHSWLYEDCNFTRSVTCNGPEETWWWLDCGGGCGDGKSNDWFKRHVGGRVDETVFLDVKDEREVHGEMVQMDTDIIYWNKHWSSSRLGWGWVNCKLSLWHAEFEQPKSSQMEAE